MPVPRGRAGVKQAMDEYEAGRMHSGSETGPVVTNPKQAIAIALSQAGLSRRNRLSQSKRAMRDRSTAASPPMSTPEICRGYRKLG